MQATITTRFNPRDVNNKSPDINFEKEETIEIKDEKDIENKLKSLQNDFFDKYGKRRGKVRWITHWRPDVWNNKIVPNIKFEVKIGDKKKEGNFSDTEDFISDQLEEKQKPVGIILQIQQFDKKDGSMGFRNYGYLINKHGKKQWGFLKGQ